MRIYTPILSGFIKISQLLVVQYAVETADGGDVAHQADALNELRDRFILHGTRSPNREDIPMTPQMSTERGIALFKVDIPPVQMTGANEC